MQNKQVGTMLDPKKIEILTTGGIMSIVGALINALLSKGPIKEIIKTSLAGILAGTLIYYVLSNADMKQVYKDFICIAISSCISSIYPRFVRFVDKYSKNKSDEHLHDTEPD